MKKLLFSILLLNIFCARAQKISTDISPGLNTMSTLGMVKNLDNNNKSVQSIFVLHGLNFLIDDFSDFKYQMTEIDIKNEVEIKKVHDLSNVLKPNEYLLQQIVKDSNWYVLGYELFSDSLKRYFLKQFSLVNNVIVFSGNTVYSDLDTFKARPFVWKARVLDNNRISFCGRKRTDMRHLDRSLFLIFDDEIQQLFEIETPMKNQDVIEIFFHDAFIAKDTLFAHYSFSKKELLSYDSSYEVDKIRSLECSPRDSGNQLLCFGAGINFTIWGNKLIFSGHSVGSNQEPFGEDFYFQEFNENFELEYDERYFLEGRESMPYFNSFVPINDSNAIMISIANQPFFGSNFPNDLNLRLYNRNTRETELFRLLQEDFTHFDDGIGVDNKLLLAGYTTRDPSTGSPNIVYYLIDYNDKILSVNNTINNTGNASIKIYPNPNKTGRVNLSWDKMASQSWQLNMYDSQGKVVFETNISQGNTESQVTISQLPKGSYILRATGSGKQVHTGTVNLE